MPNSLTNTGLYSEEIQEIIDRPPKWIMVWGVMILFILFMAILATSWFVRYPDVLHANVIITTTPSPINLISRNSGNLEILKKEKDRVMVGDLIASIKTNVNIRHLIELEEELTRNPHVMPSVNYQLGDLQPYLNDLIYAQLELTTFYKNNLLNRQIMQLNKQIKNQQQISDNANRQLALMKEELELSREKFKTDSLLHEQKGLTKVDLNSSKAIYIQDQRNLWNIETAVINSRQEIDQMEKQVMELSIQQTTTDDQLNLSFDSKRSELLSQIKKWKETFLFISPIEGRLSYLDFLETGKFIEREKALFSVVPDSGKVFGMAELPIDNSGKVKEGQRVSIRLQNYPFEQFGMLSGNVESISLLPNQGKYLLRISLPQGMISSYQKPIPFQQQLQGDVEIITEDHRLLERLFYQIIKIVRQ